MIKLNLKDKERIAEEIQKFPFFYDKDNEGYKKNDRKKSHGVKFSLLNKIPNSYFTQKCYICKIWWERMRLKILIL